VGPLIEVFAQCGERSGKQQKRMEFLDWFIKWIQQKNPGIVDDFFSEFRREMVGLHSET